MLKISDKEFNQLAEFIKIHSGIHLKSEKKTMLVGRLNGMLAEMELDSFGEFYQSLQKDRNGVLLSALIDKVTTNHTYFMRESEHFKYLNDMVLPYLKERVRDRDLRVWCAASSTGEEPYTLAILLEEYFGNYGWDKKLLATDLSLKVLDLAKKGVYHKDQLRDVSKMWVLNYFDKVDDNHYEVKPALRREVIYRRFNLLEPVFPFKKKFHVVFCRNVMIYFDAKTKEELVNKIYNNMENGGYLFIGHSETIDREKSKFKYIKPAVYRKME